MRVSFRLLPLLFFLFVSIHAANAKDSAEVLALNAASSNAAVANTAIAELRIAALRGCEC